MLTLRGVATLLPKPTGACKTVDRFTHFLYNSGLVSKKEFTMEEFKSWEEMSDLEQAQCTYWDMYKDAYGVRPRGVDTSGWSLADFDAEFKLLGEIMVQEDIARKEAEAEAVAKFEQHVVNTMCMGARDRETALRWIMDASTANGDWEYLCWDLGLPYHYFRKVA